MKYLITGGAGFVGSHLSEYLLRQGHRVYVLDNLSTGSIENVSHLKLHKNFEYMIDTTMNRSLLAELVDATDAVFHLAAAVGVRLIIESPVRTIETNVRATELVLENANKKKKKVLITSTSEVYGKSTAVPFKEDGDLVMGATHKGRWSYACSKAVDEFLALAYWKEKKCPVVVARLFNTVGPRQTGRYGMVLPNFVRQALSDQPIVIFGDGTQSRCFNHVRDSVRALAGLMESDEATGEVFNVGNGREVTINDLAQMVKDRTGSSSVIKYLPYSEAYEEGFEDMHRRVPDLKKIESAIGYKPTSTLEEIIDDVVDHYRDSGLIAQAVLAR